MEKYDEYKDSGVEWIGEIPSHWKVIPFKHCMAINNGRDYKSIQTEEGYPVMGSGGQFACASQFIYDGEVVLLGRKGTIDKPLYFKGRFWTVDTMFYAIPKRDFCCRFMYYLALTFPYDYYATSTALPSMTQSDLGNNPISVPNLMEQQSIANYLDKQCSKIDKAIATQEKRIELLGELKQNIITDAVTRGINPNVKMKDSGVEWIGEIPEHWEVKRMRYLCDMVTGDKDTIMREENGKYPFYVRSPKIERINTYSFDGEAVLMAGDGVGAGKVIHYATGKFDFHQRVYNFHHFKHIKGRFLYYYLISNFRYKIEEGGAKNTVDSVRLPWLKDFQICVPTIEEQNHIMSYIEKRSDKIDSSIEKAHHQIDLLKEYKQSLITEVVTGKRKVI